MAQLIVPSPVGPLLLASDGLSLVRLAFDETPANEAPDDLLLRAQTQLNEYFAGQRTTFDLPLAPPGTPFQKKVWQELTQIPYGQVTSYGQLAEKMGQPTATRAIGLANGQNPIAIIIPCHRVIGKDGSLTGYGGGLPRKEYLLTLEGAWNRNQMSLF